MREGGTRSNGYRVRRWDAPDAERYLWEVWLGWQRFAGRADSEVDAWEAVAHVLDGA